MTWNIQNFTSQNTKQTYNFKINERKKALQDQHNDVAQKISQGKNALGNLEATLMGLKGAISQIDWVLGLFVDETEKKDK